MFVAGLALIGAFIPAESHLIFNYVKPDADPAYVDAGIVVNNHVPGHSTNYIVVSAEPAEGAFAKIPIEQNTFEKDLGQSVFKAQTWTGTAEGTAFLISPDLVLTNHHVLAGHDDCGKFQITLTKSREQVDCRQVELCGTGDEDDFCVVRMNPLRSGHTIGSILPPLKFATEIEQGAFTLAFLIGNAEGAGIQAASYAGLKTYKNQIAHCVRAYSGNSGSPLLNAEGKVLGIHFGRGDMPGISCPPDRDTGKAVSGQYILNALRAVGKEDVADEIQGTSGSGPSAP